MYKNENFFFAVCKKITQFFYTKIHFYRKVRNHTINVILDSSTKVRKGTQRYTKVQKGTQRFKKA